MTILNEEQQRIIADSEGVKLVISGPGTGKTTTITHFLANILSTGQAKPEQVLAVTFTVKAAREMRERVRGLTGQRPDVFTMHSFARRVLCAYPPLGYTADFEIWDEKQEYRLIRHLLAAEKLDKHPQAVREILALARNTRNEKLLEKHSLSGLYKLYMQELRQNNAMDFDAMLTWCVSVFENNPAVLTHYSKKYRYLLVDEFQDTSKLQYALLLPLAKATGNLLCVGDYDQSIYGFRGADVNLILNLEKDFPDLATHYLKQNYRCTKAIVVAANSLITNNLKRRPKPHMTNRPDGVAITRKSFVDEHGEAEYVADKIADGQNNTDARWADFAVLYRIHTLSIPVTQVLFNKKIPFRVVGDRDYFDLPEIKNILCFIRLMAEPDNVEAKGDAASVLRSLGQNPPKLDALMKRLAQLKDLEDIHTVILEQTGLLQKLERNTSQMGLKALENVQELRSVLANFGRKGVKEFLEFTEQARSVESEDAVNLLTIHAAKGMEFDTVFVLGLDDQMIPNFKNQGPDDIEEERRLLYVAMTRAKNNLYLTYPRARMVKGQKRNLCASRFLQELKLDVQAKVSAYSTGVKHVSPRQLNLLAEAEASRKENPQGPWLDSRRNRWGICKHCSTFTRDWWSLDGATNICECNDCRFK